MKCSMCGQTALYRVHSLGFCALHLEDAKKISRTCNVLNNRGLRIRFNRPRLKT